MEKKSFNYETLYFSLAIEERKPVIYRIADAEIPIDWPVFEIDGSDVPALPEKIELKERRYLNDDIEQLSFVCLLRDNLRLTMELRLCRKTPFIRFRYVLSSDNAVRLTKKKRRTAGLSVLPGRCKCRTNGDTAFRIRRANARLRTARADRIRTREGIDRTDPRRTAGQRKRAFRI